MKPIVYFSREITPEKVLEMLRILNAPLEGKVAAKVHSGEEGNQNYLRPEVWKPVIDALGATVVECNTAYSGERNTTQKHKKTDGEPRMDKALSGRYSGRGRPGSAA